MTSVRQWANSHVTVLHYAPPLRPMEDRALWLHWLTAHRWHIEIALAWGHLVPLRSKWAEFREEEEGGECWHVVQEAQGMLSVCVFAVMSMCAHTRERYWVGKAICKFGCLTELGQSWDIRRCQSSLLDIWQTDWEIQKPPQRDDSVGVPENSPCHNKAPSKLRGHTGLLPAPPHMEQTALHLSDTLLVPDFIKLCLLLNVLCPSVGCG